MSLFGELKRRNVTRVAMLYVVASWLLLQVADVLFDALELPAAWGRLVLALVILGFPIVLIFSWVFEITPEGLRRESEIESSRSATKETGRKINLAAAILLVLAILVVGADRLIPETPSGAAETSEVSSVEAVPERSVAVLPFANRSAREDDVYFVDGIHDDILTQLAHIDSLTVTSRTSVERFRDPTQQGGIREIAAILGVRNILEGGIQRSGDRIRINVQLIDVTSDGHLWAETYNRELTASNLFAVQGEIAAAVAEALRAALAADEELALSETPTESLAAYDLYLLGRFHANKRTEESIELARGYFEQAITEDPNYVPALSGLADSYMLLVDYGNLDGAVAYPVAQEAIDKAMAIDDSVSEVWASLGLMHRTQADHEGAEEALLRAIELDSGNFEAWLWYSNSLLAMRRVDEALQATEEAYVLEPMSKPVNSSLGGQYFSRGDFVRARQHFERSAMLEKERAIWFQNRFAGTYYYEGNFTQAIKLSRRILNESPGDEFALLNVSGSYLALGDVPEARLWFSRAEDVNLWDREMYWAFEAEEDFDGAIAYLEDKLKLDQDRDNLATLHWLCRASYLAGNIPLARDYMVESLAILNARFEIHPADSWPVENLLHATFLIQHGDEVGLDAERGHEMLDEILAGLETLRERGAVRAVTFACLAVAHALQGDSLAAFANLNEAIDRGYRNYVNILSQPAFDDLRDKVDFVAITERIEVLLEAERVQLATVEFEPYSAPTARQPVAMSREQFRDYAGYYSDGNILVQFFVAENGAFEAQLGQNPSTPTLPFEEDMFFFPALSGIEVRFVADDSGAVTHLLSSNAGRLDRFKRVAAPPPAVELERAVLERYLGTYAWDRLSRENEDRSDVDTWTGVVKIDEEGKVWMDWDNQPKLEIVPFSETEFFVPGFHTIMTFIVNADTGVVDRMEFRKDGSMQIFQRQ